MEQNRLTYERIGSETGVSSQPPHSTEYHAPPQSTSASPWFPRHGRARRAFMWGIASTVLSGIGLLGLALFEQYNGMLSELRADLKHFNETTGEYVKKDRLQRCWERLKDASKEVAASAAAASGWNRNSGRASGCARRWRPSCNGCVSGFHFWKG